MVEKFFFALDYDRGKEAVSKGISAIASVEREFGDVVYGKLGVKLNGRHFTHRVYGGFRQFPEKGYQVFGDLKLSHSATECEKMIDIAYNNLPFDYVTVSVFTGPTALRRVSSFVHERRIKTIAFAAHTTIPEKEVLRLHKGSSINDLFLNWGNNAVEGDCDAIVLEGERLGCRGIRLLPIKKLVTAIRISPDDYHDQQERITLLEDLAQLKDHVNYVVVSSKYLDRPHDLIKYFAALL